MRKLLTIVATAQLAVAISAQAQVGQLDISGATSTIVTSDTRTGGNVGINNPLYLPARSEYSGIANLWIRGDAPGNDVQGACTGNLLWTGRHILTAAHCIANSSGVLDGQFGTARFRNAGGGWSDYSWSSVAIKSGYSGAVADVQDVAVLTLDADVDATFERYGIASENPLAKRVRFQGYGRIGTGLTGDTQLSDQFSDDAVLRRGWNTFDTSCTEAAGPSPIFVQCADLFNSNKGAFGGILLADFDNPLNPNASNMCTQLLICVPGQPGFDEVGMGRGDSGSGAFLESNNLMVGVASWGVGATPTISQFNRVNGFACVANYAPNQACVDNYNFILNAVNVPTVVPEPSTYALMFVGLLGVGAMARRRGVSA